MGQRQIKKSYEKYSGDAYYNTTTFLSERRSTSKNILEYSEKQNFIDMPFIGIGYIEMCFDVAKDKGDLFIKDEEYTKVKVLKSTKDEFIYAYYHDHDNTIYINKELNPNKINVVSNIIKIKQEKIHEIDGKPPTKVLERGIAGKIVSEHNGDGTLNIFENEEENLVEGSLVIFDCGTEGLVTRIKNNNMLVVILGKYNHLTMKPNMYVKNLNKELKTPKGKK